MARMDERVTVTLRADDQVTPVLRRMRAELWWVQHGGVALGLFSGAMLFITGFLVGHVT